MTRNTLSYLSLKETERSNRVKEAQQYEELSRKRDELSETIRNNLRNYGVNVSKNEIQKLANDQLNTREVNKLLAQIQDNLANQQLKLQQNLETERNNKAKLQIEEELKDIKRMDTLLSAAKATGKTPTAILLSWFTNQANLQAFAGTNNLNEYTKQIKDWLEIGDEAIIQDIPSSKPGKITNAQRVSYDMGYDPISRTRKHVASGGRTSEQLQKYKEAYLTDAAYDKRSRNNIWKNREENEIPEDYSNSKGPNRQGGNDEVITSKTTSSLQNGNSNTEVQRTREQGPYQSSNFKDSSGSSIIWSGNTKQKQEVGPGIGLAFS